MILQKLRPIGSVEKINDILSAAPFTYFIDSRLDENIYCDVTKKGSGTNLDDVYGLVKDLPMRVEQRIGEDVGMDGLARELTGAQGERPALDVMHLGSFEGVRSNEYGDDTEKISAFLDQVASQGGAPKFIIYSRNQVGLDNLKRKYPDNVEVIPMKNMCFYTDSDRTQLSDNGRDIQRAIRREFEPVLNAPSERAKNNQKLGAFYASCRRTLGLALANGE